MTDHILRLINQIAEDVKEVKVDTKKQIQEWNDFKVENATEKLLNKQHRENEDLHHCKFNENNHPGKKQGESFLSKMFTPKLLVTVWFPMAFVAAVYTGKVLEHVGKIWGILP